MGRQKKKAPGSASGLGIPAGRRSTTHQQYAPRDGRGTSAAGAAAAPGGGNGFASSSPSSQSQSSSGSRLSTGSLTAGQPFEAPSHDMFQAAIAKYVVPEQMHTTTSVGIFECSKCNEYFAFSEWNTEDSQILRQYTSTSGDKISDRYANTHAAAGGRGALDPELAFCCETCVAKDASQGFIKVSCSLCSNVPRKQKFVRHQDMQNGIFPELFLLKDHKSKTDGASFWVHGHCAVACNLHTETELRECEELCDGAADENGDGHGDADEVPRKMSMLIEINKYACCFLPEDGHHLHNFCDTPARHDHGNATEDDDDSSSAASSSFPTAQTSGGGASSSSGGGAAASDGSQPSSQESNDTGRLKLFQHEEGIERSLPSPSPAPTPTAAAAATFAALPAHMLDLAHATNNASPQFAPLPSTAEIQKQKQFILDTAAAAASAAHAAAAAAKKAQEHTTAQAATTPEAHGELDTASIDDSAVANDETLAAIEIPAEGDASSFAFGSASATTAVPTAAPAEVSNATAFKFPSAKGPIMVPAARVFEATHPQTIAAAAAAAAAAAVAGPTIATAASTAPKVSNTAASAASASNTSNTNRQGVAQSTPNRTSRVEQLTEKRLEMACTVQEKLEVSQKQVEYYKKQKLVDDAEKGAEAGMGGTEGSSSSRSGSNSGKRKATTAEEDENKDEDEDEEEEVDGSTDSVMNGMTYGSSGSGSNSRNVRARTDNGNPNSMTHTDSGNPNTATATATTASTTATAATTATQITTIGGNGKGKAPAFEDVAVRPCGAGTCCNNTMCKGDCGGGNAGASVDGSAGPAASHPPLATSVSALSLSALPKITTIATTAKSTSTSTSQSTLQPGSTPANTFRMLVRTILGGRHTSIYTGNYRLNVGRSIVKKMFDEIIERSDDLREEDPFHLNPCDEQRNSSNSSSGSGNGSQTVDNDAMPSSSPMESTDYGGHSDVYSLDMLRQDAEAFEGHFKAHLQLLTTALKAGDLVGEEQIKQAVAQINTFYNLDSIEW